MDDINIRIKEACAARVGREVSEAEVLEIASWFRQFAGLIAEWSRDEQLAVRLGLTSGSRGDQQADQLEPTTSALLSSYHAAQRSV